MSYIGNDLRSGRSETYVFTASGDETSVTASDSFPAHCIVDSSGVV
jgi:hypothetical protein